MAGGFSVAGKSAGCEKLRDFVVACGFHPYYCLYPFNMNQLAGAVMCVNLMWRLFHMKGCPAARFRGNNKKRCVRNFSFHNTAPDFYSAVSVKNKISLCTKYV
jgi:hypothetical protein